MPQAPGKVAIASDPGITVARGHIQGRRTVARAGKKHSEGFTGTASPWEKRLFIFCIFIYLYLLQEITILLLIMVKMKKKEDPEQTVLIFLLCHLCLSN